MILKASTASFSVLSSVVNFHFIPSRSLHWSLKQWVSLRWAHQKQNWHLALHNCNRKLRDSKKKDVVDSIAEGMPEGGPLTAHVGCLRRVGCVTASKDSRIECMATFF